MFYGWVILLVLCFDYVIMLCGTLYTYGSILTPMAADLGLTMAQASAGQTLLTICSAVVVLLAGQLLEKRLQPKTVLLWASISGMIGCGLMGFVVNAQNIGLFYLCYALFISNMNICGSGVASQVLLTRWFSLRRSTVIAALMSMGGVGGFLFPLLTSWLLELTGSWRSIWIFVMVCCGICFVLSLIFLRNDPAEMGLKPDNGLTSVSGSGRKLPPFRSKTSFTLKQALKSPFLYACIVTQVGISCGAPAIGSYLISHLGEHGVAAAAAAGAVSIYAFFNIFGRFSSGFLQDWINPRFILRITLPFLAIVLFFAPVLHTALQGWIFAGLFGLAFSLSVTCPVNILMNSFGTDHYSQIYSVVYMSSQVLVSLVGLSAGVIHDAVGSYSPYFYLLSALMLVSGLCQIFARPPQTAALEAQH